MSLLEIQEARYVTRRKLVSIEVVEEVGGRFVIFTYADGAFDREVIDHTKKPTRKARRPRRKLKLENGSDRSNPTNVALKSGRNSQASATLGRTASATRKKLRLSEFTAPPISARYWRSVERLTTALSMDAMDLRAS